MVQSEQLEEGGMQIIDRDSVDSGFLAHHVRFTMVNTPFDEPSRHQAFFCEHMGRSDREETTRTKGESHLEEPRGAK